MNSFQNTVPRQRSQSDDLLIRHTDELIKKQGENARPMEEKQENPQNNKLQNVNMNLMLSQQLENLIKDPLDRKTLNQKKTDKVVVVIPEEEPKPLKQQTNIQNVTQQENQLLIENSSPQKKKPAKKKPVPGQLHSVLTNADIQKQIILLKKKTLVLQIALMGFNVHMAEYIMEHNQLNYNLPQNMLMNQVIEKVLEIENTISELKKKRQEKLMVFDDSIDNHSIDESILMVEDQAQLKKDHLNVQRKNNRITKNEMKIKKLFYGLSEKYQSKPVVRQTQKHLQDNPKEQFLTTNNQQKQLLIPQSIGFSDVKFEEIPEHEMCLICMSKLTESISLSCQHFFCADCVNEYLKTKIKCSEVLKITCAFDGCQAVYEESDIKKLVSEELFDQYQKFKKNKILELDDNVRWCVKPGCEKYVKGNMLSTMLTCECGQKICFICRNAYHQGKTCEEAIDENYKAIMKKFIIQKCPKCTAPIQKKEGCNHMTCFKCHFMFCWLCRARYTRKHYQSYNCFGCPKKQFTQDQPYDRPKWKKYGGIVCDFFTWIFLIPVLPFIMLYYGIGAPLILCKKYNYKNYKNLNKCEFCLLLVLGLIALPIFFILEIIPGLCMMIHDKFKYD